ncbi:MAG: SanA/YdcF family protein [Candidatus Saccharimonadales bacterium]
MRNLKIVGLIKRWRWPLLVLFVLLFALLLWGPSVYANLSTRGLRYDLSQTAIKDIPKREVAVVFGAGIDEDGTPTPYLQWRINTAVDLYKAGRVGKLLMSGDNSSLAYDEPEAMRLYAMKQGVKSDDIILDFAGFDTYDSCYRARHVFELHTAILVSQGYHLPRAIMTCNGVGVSSIGVDALNQGRGWTISYIVREWLATDKALAQLALKPGPTVGGPPLPIK